MNHESKMRFLQKGDCFYCGACHLLDPLEQGGKTFCNHKCRNSYDQFLLKSSRMMFALTERRKKLGILDAENDARHCRECPAY